MNEDGYLKIVGRTKELIIVGGENVYPREIEELLYTFPQVVDVHVSTNVLEIRGFTFYSLIQVIGVPDERKGEEICAWVKVLDKTKVTEDDIRNFCKQHVST